MATTIRLTRMGRKQRPFYRVVVVDSRGRRDGDYIESLGYYNPMPDAFEVSVNADRALHWLDRGVTMSSTARSLLRREGVLYRWHLQKSGADAAEIDAKMEEFLSRRGEQTEAIKAQTKAKLEAWRSAKEEAVKAAKKEAEATEAAAAEEEKASDAETAEASAGEGEEAPAATDGEDKA